MPRINKKLLIILIISIAILIAILSYRSSYTKKPIWDAVYDRSAPAIQLNEAAKVAQNCKPEDGKETCDAERKEMFNKLMDANFYNVGYEYCIKKFKKTAEECKKLVDNVNTNGNLNYISPSNRDSTTIENGKNK